MSKRISDMSAEEYAAYSLGWEHGEYNAINCCFGKKVGFYGEFDTPAEAKAYEAGYRRGFDSID